MYLMNSVGGVIMVPKIVVLTTITSEEESW